MENLMNNNRDDMRYVIKRSGDKVPFKTEKIESCGFKSNEEY